MNNPQIYRDITQVLEFFTKKGWSENMPKVWRFTLYTVVIDYILTMLSASADAYDMQEGRVVAEWKSNNQINTNRL